jgi:hypothetical protein
MKTVVKVSLIVIMAVGTLQAERLHRYAVKSGKVTYDITGSKEIKAIGLKESIKGKKRVVFDAYGEKEIEEFKKITESKSNGKSTFEEEHEFTYTDGVNQYRVDFDKNRIVKRKNPYYAANYTLIDGKDIKAFMPKQKNQVQKPWQVWSVRYGRGKVNHCVFTKGSYSKNIRME